MTAHNVNDLLDKVGDIEDELDTLGDTVAANKKILDDLGESTAGADHTHPQYSTTDHTHSYAAESHNHSTSDITGLDDAIANAEVPVGTIVMWGNATPPDGWLELKGQILRDSEHPILYGLFGIRLPDMRGEFVRGWASNTATKQKDKGRLINSYQGFNVQSLGVAYYNYTNDTNYVWAAQTRTEKWTACKAEKDKCGDSIWSSTDQQEWGMPVVNGSSLTRPQDTKDFGSETRPRNVALMFIVKAG